MMTHMKSRRFTVAATAAVLLGVLAGCGGGMTTFLHHEYNFGFIERVAIVPMDNLSDDRGAGARATHVLLTEVLAAEVFDVVEPGEVSNALSRQGLIRTAEMTKEQIINVGRELNVQALFLGVVTESSTLRGGTSSVAKVTLAIRLVETERGVTVWSSSATSGGRGLWASLFGTSGKSTSEVTRDCVRKVLKSLLN